MQNLDEKYMAVIALLAAIFVAAHSSSGGGPIVLLGIYCYWLVRVAAHGLLFFGVRSIIERYSPKFLSLTTTTTLAIILSHLPFVLIVTAIDIVLGYPELGIGDSAIGEKSRIAEFALEMFFLLDNHIALCLLLTVPRWILNIYSNPLSTNDGSNSGMFLSAITPPLNGDILWVEAQEHYVRITTQNETRMVLARFSDIIRELSIQDGLQVHRSHWVAKSAIAQEKKKGQSLSLILITGDIVPVSRSFKNQISVG